MAFWRTASSVMMHFSKLCSNRSQEIQKANLAARKPVHIPGRVDHNASLALQADRCLSDSVIAQFVPYGQSTRLSLGPA